MEAAKIDITAANVSDRASALLETILGPILKTFAGALIQAGICLGRLLLAQSFPYRLLGDNHNWLLSPFAPVQEAPTGNISDPFTLAWHGRPGEQASDRSKVRAFLDFGCRTSLFGTWNGGRS
ncbi:hypothetical protein CO651_09420 [Rhizobium phaseoli]|nr:hypothetical protein CO648_16570 [Rhizobium phaseoli]PDS72172.1 hypothetical protein CO651_09420 [Rhizobium phaseoli]